MDILFTHSSVDEHLDYFYFLTILKNHYYEHSYATFCANLCFNFSWYLG